MAAPEGQPCPHCGSLLDAGDTQGLCPRCVVAQLLSPLDLDDDGQDSDKPLGTVGGYELLGKIAAGGMGIVHRARQPGLDRVVALKLIIEGRLAGHQEIERFLFEAKAAAELEHPNIVSIYEVGEDNGQPYFSMHYIEGGSLADWVDELHAPDGERDFRSAQASAVRMMVKIARAVEYAHSRNILHRDLKPSNVLVDHQGEPHITDFGLAKRLDNETKLTLTWQMMGSPAFMAPEQARGAAVPGSDIYSLGVMLYQLLTDKVPFGGKTPLEVIKRAAEESPAHLRKHNRQIDRDLEMVCLKCLEKNPADRFSSAGDCADDLSRWLAGEPVVARPLPPWKRAIRWGQRYPGRAAAIFIGACLLAGTAGSLLWQSEKTDRIRRAELYATHIQLAAESTATLDWRGARAELEKAKEFMPDGVAPIEWKLLTSQFPTPIASGKVTWQGITGMAIAGEDPLVLIFSTEDGDLAAWDVEKNKMIRHSKSTVSEHFYYNGGGESILNWNQNGQPEVIGGSFSEIPETNAFMARTGMGHAASDGEVGSIVTGSIPNRKGGFQQFEVALPAAIESLALDGQKFLAFMCDGHFEVWDVDHAQPQQEVWVDHHFGSARALDFSKNGMRLATGATDGVVRLWGSLTGNLEATFTLGPSEIAAVAFFEPSQPPGFAVQHIIAVSVDGNYKIWDTVSQGPSGREVDSLTPPLTVATNSKFMAGVGGVVNLNDPGLGRREIFPFGELLAIGSIETEVIGVVRRSEEGAIHGGIALLRWAPGNPYRTVVELPDHKPLPGIAAITPDGEHAALLLDRHLQILDCQSGKELRKISGFKSGDRIFALSNDTAAIGTGGETLSLLSLEDGAKRDFGSPTGVEHVAFSHDSTRLALAHGAKVSTYSFHDDAWRWKRSIDVESAGPLAWSAGIWTLVVANQRTGNLEFFNSVSGQKLFPLMKRGNWEQVHCTPDGSKIIAADANKTVIFSASMPAVSSSMENR